MNVGSACARHARSRAVAVRLHGQTMCASTALVSSQRVYSSSHPHLSARHTTQISQQEKNANQQAGRRCMTSMNRGGDDGNDDWLPPDDSPLVFNKNNFGYKSFVSLPTKDGNMSSIEDIDEDEINVIDLEATLSSKQNQEFLQNEIASLSSDNSEFSSEFEVEFSDIGWSEVLRELRDDGNYELLERLVKDYNLQSHLDTLDVKADGGDVPAIRTVDDEETWDDEFEQSLEGLSQEELIDELIENSPAFSQLEMEILSQELDRFDQDGSDRGLEFDSLDDVDLSGNTNYKDFRAMVLEDYVTKRATAKGASKKRVIAGKQLDATTNFATKSDFTAYPLDWKDYDSNSAFKRDFAENDESWVRPSTEFFPSRANNVEGESWVGGQDLRNDTTESSVDEFENSIDWLRTRRSRLGGTDEQNILKPSHLLTPEQADSFRHQKSQIPIIPYTLLTTTEISTSLSAQGGTDIHIIDTSEFDSSRFVGTGCNFMMLVTGRNASHIRVLADSIVRNLKARKLHERGVIGASQGVEGGQDIFTNKHSRNRARRNGAMNSSGKIDDDWMVVDCENIHVHIMEETTRKCLNIEGLWDLTNPNSEGRKLRRINLSDDDAVDEYIVENPIPDDYAAKIFNDGGGRRTDGWISGGIGSRVQAVPVFQKKSFSEKWSGKGGSKGKKQRKSTR